MRGRFALVMGAAAVAGLLASGGVARADDVEDGGKAFKKYCSSCHTVEAGKNRVGPSLFGVVGRKSGSVEGFRYSEAMQAAGTWDTAALDKYLEDPKATVPGNKMTFNGVKKEDERKALIAYLASVK